MDNKIRSFEDLECWKTCTELRRYDSKLIKKFPKNEQYELTSQMKRASRSVTHNIAEGYGRFIIKKTFSIVDNQEVLYMNL